MSEFEDRERDALGELPPNLARERREKWPHVEPRTPPVRGIGSLGARSGIPSDIVNNQRALGVGEDGGLGSPIIPASVTTVYDARPLNARDWMQAGYDAFVFPNGGPGKQTVELSYIVPDGYISILRSFNFRSIQITELFSGEDTILLTSLFVDNLIVADYSGLLLGQFTSRPVSTFVLAREGQSINLRISVNTAVWPTREHPVYMEMYGQNILSRGLPLPFEIMTQTMSGS